MIGTKRDAAEVESPKAAVLFAANLKSWRLKHRLYLKEMAAELKVCVSTVEGWETGNRFPSGFHLTRISDFMGIPVCRLFCVAPEACPFVECVAGCCPNAAMRKG